MNKEKNKNGLDFPNRIALAVIAVHIVSITAISILFRTLPEDNRFAVLNDTIIELETCVALENTIINSMKELSNLASKSGYELALNDIIKDHKNSISIIRDKLPLLKKVKESGQEKSGHKIIVYAIIILAIQGILLLLYLSRINRAALFTVSLISRQINDIITGGKPDPVEKNNIVEFRELYDRFSILLEKINSGKIKMKK